MNYELYTDYKWYFFLFCLLLGLGYALLLYFRNKKSSLSPKVRIVLGVLRFLSISILAFLLLSPLVKQQLTNKEKPIIIVGQDNSSSIMLNSDSLFYKNNYIPLLQQTIAELEKDYDVHTYLFGQDTRSDNTTNFSDNKTDIAGFINTVQKQYENRNVGAIVLASDGIYNSGIQPANATNKLMPPIYTIALGDTSMRVDAAINHIKYNKIAYLGNKFPLEISIKAHQLNRQHKKLTIAKDGKVVAEREITYNSTNFSSTEQFVLEADNKGLQYYTIAIEPCDNETSLNNNRRTMTIDVIDNKQKIAIVANSPHPDIAALKRCIDDNENYEVNTFLAKDFKEPAANYNLIVMHQLPSADIHNNEVVAKIMDAKVPILFIIGEQTNLTRLNNLKAGLQIFTKINKTDEAQPLFNKEFTLFTFDENTYKAIEQFPPLTIPFGEYRTATNAQSLFTAKIGTLGSGNPMICFVQMHDIRYGFIVGEGIWKWALADYREHNTRDNFNTLIDKTIMYLSLRINKNKFRINTQNSYHDTEPIVFEGELYNDNFEPINTPEVVLTLDTPDGEKKEYRFNQTNNGYHLNIGSMPEGQYTYTATTTYNNKQLTASGAFVVEANMLEDINLVANHTLLNTLSAKTGGQLLYPADIDNLPTLLKQRDDIKTIIYTEERYSEILNTPAVFILIVLLLGTEWILRKFYGEL